jgi:ubiquinone/menaquinone biosynthesis C-methylase UbiE
MATTNRSARFWDKTAARYAARPVGNEAVYERKLEITRAYFRPDMEVLEFGCGTGSTAIAHAPHVKHIHATDFSSEMIEIARTKADAAQVQNVTFETTTVDDLEASDESFDAVLGLNVLHLLKDREAVITKVYRLLKPGGVFVSSTVCLGRAWKLLGWIVPVGQFLGLMPQVRAMSTGELIQDLTSAGFSIDHEWEPGVFKSIFIVAKKPEESPAA